MSQPFFPFSGGGSGSSSGSPHHQQSHLLHQQVYQNTGSNPKGSPSVTSSFLSAYSGPSGAYNSVLGQRFPNQFGFAASKALNSLSANANSLYGSNQLINSVSSSTASSIPSIPITSSAVSIHHQKQLELATKSRLASSPHHHARVAASVSRAAALAANSQDSINTNPNTSTSSANNTDAANKADESKKENTPHGWTALDMGGMLITNLSKEVYRYTFLTSLYLNHNRLVSLSPEISRLSSLAILDLSANKLTSLPSELGLVVTLKELLLFDNQLTFLPAEFGQLYQVEVLGLEGNPLSEPILSLVQKEGTTSVIAYLRDTCPVGLPPAEREWIALEDDTYNPDAPDTFSLLCYNMLCEKYATPTSYAYTPSWALAWEYRKDLLLQEILNFNADMVCLQEVEMGQFEDYFKEQLAQLGDYDGIFYPKSRARTMSEYDRRQVDGCAIIFKANKYKILEKQNIEFQQLAMQRPDLRQYDDVFNRLTIKDNVVTVCLLEHKQTGYKFMVANAHLHWDPAYKDVKLIQTAMMMQEIEKLTSIWRRSHGDKAQNTEKKHFPTLICGDFNSLPDSAVFELLSMNTVSSEHEDVSRYNYGPYSEEGGLVHSLPLSSAYSNLHLALGSGASTSDVSSAMAGGLDFTNFTPTFRGVIDYIWYTKDVLNVTGLLSNVDREYVSRCVGFPNAHHPSDHIPLVASFKLRAGGSGSTSGNASQARKVVFK